MKHPASGVESGVEDVEERKSASKTHSIGRGGRRAPEPRAALAVRGAGDLIHTLRKQRKPLERAVNE